LEIRDPIHGNIQLDETEAKIINTVEMQRLRYIRQLDVTHLIFPGANHTRFEHSLGTMRLTRELVSNIYDDYVKEFSYIGLLHDIGHGPFSHLSESVIKKHLNKTHEQIGEDIIKDSEIKDIISDSGLSFTKIMSYFKEADKIDVVGGPLGSDRIDYLMRDSHYTGVAYGIIDSERIKSRLVLYKNKVAISEEGISGAESLLIARYFMYYNVYAHHAKTIANKMLVNAIEFALEKNVFDAQELSMLYDEELVYKIANSDAEIAVNLVNRVMKRDLFKRAYNEMIKKDIEVKKLEDEIIKAGFAREDFIVNVSNFGGNKDNLDIVDSDKNFVGKLTEVSPFVKTLIDVLSNSKRLIVACDKDNVNKLNSIVKKFVE
jgi:uncharacterized protein